MLMAFDIKSLTGNTPHDKRPIIGAVKVNKPFVYHDASYECAAWWEDREAQLGVHPVYLGRSYHHPKNLTITAHISAKVVNDYFPGLWCGNLISREPYKPKHIGEERTIYKGIEVVEAIQSTGNSPDGDIDWFIHPSWWPVFLDEALAEMREDYRRLPEFWSEWDSLKKESFHPKMDGRWQFDDEFRSKVGMIAHFGSLLEKWARRIEKINWHSSRWHEPSSYMQELHAKNTEWAKAIPILLND
jgi:hypothetical protein